MIKKVILLLAIATGLLLAACGDNTSTNIPAPTATPSGTTVSARLTTTAPVSTTAPTTTGLTTAPKTTTVPKTTTAPATTTTKTAAAAGITTADKAMQVLAERLEADKIYSGRLEFSCISFLPGEENPQYFEVELREKHGGGCAGDSATAPVLDRFQVYRDGNKILWYDVITDSFRPYADLKANH